MKENKKSLIIKEYYNIISPLLPFSSCDKISETEDKVLSLLCEINKCSDLFDECRALTEDAKSLQSYAEGALFLASDGAEHSIAYDVKMDVLADIKTDLLRNFNEFIFIRDLKDNANKGDKNSCKLLAFLNWLGLLVPQNRVAALNIWSALAMSGDRPSTEMLIYGYSDTENRKECKRWRDIYDILKREDEAFSAVALYSNYPDYTEEEVQTANVIMFISQKLASNGAKVIDRPMLYYAINSKADYKTKMEMLSTNTNYYLAMHYEDRFSDKKYGF